MEVQGRGRGNGSIFHDLREVEGAASIKTWESGPYGGSFEAAQMTGAQ